MKKTKKALLAALACSAVLAGTLGLAACGGGSDGGDSGTTPPAHEHNYVNWQSNEDGTHTGTCNNTVGTCDKQTETLDCNTDGKDGVEGACSKCGYKAEEDDPTKIKVGTKTFESLDEEGVTLTFQGLTTGKTYKLSSENEKVGFWAGNEMGNPITFKFNPMLMSTVVVYSTEGTLTNVTVKLEEVQTQGGEDDDFTTIEVNTEVEVTTADGFNPVKYQIELASGTYQILVEGAAIDVNMGSDVVLGCEYDEDGLFVVYTDVEKALDLTESSYYYNADNIYYIEVYANVTFKVVPYEHVHTENEEVWESDSTGHWHPLTCVHGYMGEKGTVEEHHFGELSAADEDGIKTKTCEDCGYEESDISDLTATAVTGGASLMGAWEATPVTAGTYKTTIEAKEDYNGGYNPGEYYFSLSAGDAAKSYTIKILTNNTQIVSSEAETLKSEAGAEYEVILRANQKFEFGVTTNDNVCDSDYSCDVAFKIIENDDPEEGSVKLPIIATEGDNTKSVEANQSVYYVIPSAYSGTLSGDLKITFGEGVTVTYLGTDKNNEEGTALTSGDIIMDSAYEYYAVYLCVSSTSGAISFNVESVIAEGKAGNPIVAEFGADKSNQVALEMDIENEVYVYGQWFKLESAEGGAFLVKADANYADLQLYSSVDDYQMVDPDKSGSIYKVTLTAGVPMYIYATGNENVPYTFTVISADDVQPGLVEDNPLVITASGEYDLVDAFITYVTVTVEADSTVVFTYGEGVESFTDRVVFYSDCVGYAEGIAIPANSGGDNKLTVNLEAGTYHFQLMTSEGTTGDKFTVTITPKA